jgi:hypothetical protein
MRLRALRWGQSYCPSLAAGGLVAGEGGGGSSAMEERAYIPPLQPMHLDNIYSVRITSSADYERFCNCTIALGRLMRMQGSMRWRLFPNALWYLAEDPVPSSGADR